LKTRTGWRRSGYLHDILFSNGRDASKDITREPGFRSRQNVRVGTASTVLAEIDHSRFQNRPLANRRINLALTKLHACFLDDKRSFPHFDSPEKVLRLARAYWSIVPSIRIFHASQARRSASSRASGLIPRQQVREKPKLVHGHRF
jgi:hypothetical protein